MFLGSEGIGGWVLREFLDLLAEGFLTFRQFTGRVAKALHLIGELARGFLAEFLLHFLELLARPGRGVGGLSQFARFEFLGGLLHVFAGLVEVLAFFGQVGAVLFGIHALGEVVHLAEEFALLFLEPLELALDLGLFPRGGLLKLIFEFLDLLGDGLLAAREILEPVENGEVLLLLGGEGGILGGGLLLVFELLLLKLEVHVALLFLLRLRGARRRALRHRDLGFAGAGLEQFSISVFGAVHRDDEKFTTFLLGNGVEFRSGLGHVLFRRLERGPHLGILDLGEGLVGLGDDDVLRLGDDADILGV